MEENLRVTILYYIDRDIPLFFRDSLESITESTYENFDIIVADRSGSESNGSIAQEFFPDPGRVIYKRLRRAKSKGSGLQYCLSYITGDVVLFLEDFPRLSPGAISDMVEKLQNGADVVYSDNDEIVGSDRMNPDFKSGPNKELLRHRNYIGNIFAMTKDAVLTTGGFKTVLSHVPHLDLLLRIFEKKLTIAHVEKLLYSKRRLDGYYSEEGSDIALKREQAVVISAHLKRQGVAAVVTPKKRRDFFEIIYDSHGYKNHRKDYIVLRDKGVRVALRHAIPRLFGYIRQPDVGVAGLCFLKNPFFIDNCGYIFDKNGFAYPVANGQNIFFEGVGNRCIIPQDVSMVDLGFCLIKKKLFKHLGGFDRELTDRDMALDFCLKVQRNGFRVVFDPAVRAYRGKASHESSAQSNEILKARWEEKLKAGDPFYNRNLPMGLYNYILY